MNKYRLFDEFCNKEIYGKDLADAILHAGKLSRPGKTQDNVYYPGETVEIAKVIGYEDTKNATRGNKKYLRVVVELFEVGEPRIGIDVEEYGEIEEV